MAVAVAVGVVVTVGVAVAVWVGVGVAVPVTSIVPSMPPCAWQKKWYVPGALNVQ